jgi:hypothetical protein
MTSEEQIGRLLERKIADNARVDAALAALQIAKSYESRSPDGDGRGIPRTEAIPSAAAGRSQDETPRRIERTGEPDVLAQDKTKVAAETQKPRAGSEPADSHSPKYVTSQSVDQVSAERQQTERS